MQVDLYNGHKTLVVVMLLYFKSEMHNCVSVSVALSVIKASFGVTG